MEIENVLSSKLRMKILKLIAQLGELNTSDVARRLKVNYKTANDHLKLLEAEGILQRKTFGRISLYRFSERSPKAKAIQSLIELWQQQDNEKPR